MFPIQVVESRTVPAQLLNENFSHKTEVNLKLDLVAAVSTKFLLFVEDGRWFVWKLLALVRRPCRAGCAEVDRGLGQRVTLLVSYLCISQKYCIWERKQKTSHSQGFLEIRMIKNTKLISMMMIYTTTIMEVTLAIPD